MENKKYLGLDYGSKNIGIAFEQIGIALPYTTISTKEFSDKIPVIVAEKNITDIVIGHAIGYDLAGKQIQIFKQFASNLKKILNPDIVLHFQDEDLSTFEAQASLDAFGHFI